MRYKDKVRDIFSYLLSVKNLNQKSIKNLCDYDKLYWEEALCSIYGCVINSDNSNDFWVKVNKDSVNLYDQFFKLYQQSQKKGEEFEIVWGHGLIAWKLKNEKILHPVLTTRMKIEFDVSKEEFYLVPAGKTILETSIFEGISECNISNIFSIEDKVRALAIDPRNMDEVRDIFLELLTGIDIDGKLNENFVTSDKIEFKEHPVIYNTPVIIIRKSNMKLWQIEINNIIKEIDRGYPIPATIKALVDDKLINQSEADIEEWKEVGEDILFPLPANYEQKEIVKRIAENQGVVVQGPPGTGKSHTIANLICHLLAHGKRILVTSQTDRALKVLTEKIPDQIRPLCISILGNDTNSLKELNESVRRITDNLSMDTESIHKDINILQQELNLCRKNQQILYGKIKESQRLENENINYYGEHHNIIDIAKWVKNNEKKHSWVEDKIDIEETIPLSNNEFEVLIYLLGELSKEDKYKFDSIKNVIDKLPTNEEICSNVVKYKELRSEYEKYQQNLYQWRIPDNNRCDYDKLLKLLSKCRDKMEDLENGIWGKMLKSYHSSKIAKETFKDLVYKGKNYILVLTRIRNELRNHRVDMPNKIDLDKFAEDFNILYEVLNSKGKLGRMFKIIHSKCNYILEECRVDDKPIETLEQALVIKLYIQQRSIFKELRTIWNNTIKDYGGRVVTSDMRESEIIIIEEGLAKLNTIVDWDTKYRSDIINSFGKISMPEDIDWHKKETYDYLIESVNCIKSVDEYNGVKAYVEVLKKLILATGKLKDLYNAIDALDINKIEKVLEELNNIKTLRNKSLKIDRLLEKLYKVCPKTVNKIIDNWDTAFEKFNDWEEAWKWAKWNSLLDYIYNLNPEALEESIEEEKRREKILIKDIVAKKTWYSQILRTTEVQKRSLFSWMQAVKRIGKGKGKMVSEYRKIAQMEMEKCKEAIPVWIMPLNRVIENINLSNDLFDVIIFDESSQSDIFSLCALMRAKKAVIVGDDKQISPETVGVDQGFIHSLIDKWLKNIPQREWFDLQTSLYDTALRVFPSRLMLKEHFRCIPEIIGFSNKLTYAGEIKALRYPTSHEALYPPVVSVKVKEAFRDQGKPLNVFEAEALVDKILECCKDRRYFGMSMGVISLLGEGQSELIENMLREKLGVEEMIKRKIICGDAYSFQGDERDIMFLSMVISNNVKFAPLTREADIRRFNVAASRARNQMWLFHSVELEELNSECVRYSLLNYCLNYDKYSKKDKNIEYVFQSRLQKDVYNIIKNQGYRILPEVKVGRYKVDFMVEGSRSRAAIICDGDTSTEKYNWRENIERQLDLERVGWTFCRIRGSEFYHNPEKTMEKLFKKLNKIGIEQYNVEKVTIESLKVV